MRAGVSGRVLGSVAVLLLCRAAGARRVVTAYYEVEADTRYGVLDIYQPYKVNAKPGAKETLCYDLSSAVSCYVADVRLPKGLTGADADAFWTAAQAKSVAAEGSFGAIALGSFVAGEGAYEGYGVLAVDQAWAGVGVKSMIVAAVGDSGIRCVTTPCPSTSFDYVNKRKSANVVDFVFDTGLDEKVIAAAGEATSVVLMAAAVKHKPQVATVSGIALPLGTGAREPMSCGSRTAEGPMPQCAIGAFCDFTLQAQCGRADAPGTCAPVPKACFEIYDPVCGCDGLTYATACHANLVSMSVLYEGECADADRVPP